MGNQCQVNVCCINEKNQDDKSNPKIEIRQENIPNVIEYSIINNNVDNNNMIPMNIDEL